MKKLIYATLIAVFLAAALISCGSKNQVNSNSNPAKQSDQSDLPRVSVFIDLPSANSGSIQDFFAYVPGNGKDFLIITETIPPEGQERDAALAGYAQKFWRARVPMCFSAPAGLPAGERMRLGFLCFQTRPWRIRYSCRWTIIFQEPSTWNGTALCRL